jgi:hypothetical protein
VWLLGCGGRKPRQQTFWTQCFAVPDKIHIPGSESVTNEEIVDATAELLSNFAFAVGIPFEKAPLILEKHKQKLKNLDPTSFCIRMNEIFKSEFKDPRTQRPVSHLTMIPPCPLCPKGASPLQASVESLQLTWQNHIPILKIPDFYYSESQLEQIMKQVASSEALIIDLRDNEGGFVDLLGNFLSYFLPPDTTYMHLLDRDLSQKCRSCSHAIESKLCSSSVMNFMERHSQASSISKTSAIGVPLFKGRVIVLVNKNSMSCTEMAAATLRDLKNAEIVGETTGGCCLTALLVEFSNGINLQFPLADIFTSKGERIEGIGVSPTRPEFHVGSQQALEKALQCLQETLLPL